MILEHEILEQLLDEAWPLGRVIDFLEEHNGNAWQILLHHVGDGNLVLRDPDTCTVPGWRADEILRSRKVVAGVLVQCTDQGAQIIC